jgi:hypothetical protein
VTAYYLISPHTIEDDLCSIIQAKQDIINKVLDGKSQRGTQLNIYDKLERAIRKRRKLTWNGSN